MSAEATVMAAAAGACVVSYILTRVAQRIALATGFVDRPKGYKGHLSATPYLGGAAVLCAALATTVLLTGADRALIAVLGCAAVLVVVGTIDDRVALPPLSRVAAELGVAAVLFAVGIHWSPFGVDVLDFAFSAAWVIGIVNAFNLMDNTDGAAATVTGVSAAAIGVIALAGGQLAIAVAAFAVAGACLGFLPHNLAGPARIFLGDGGSMPLGFIVAALSMAALQTASLGAGAVLAGGLVAGLPILDTSLVVVSRHRRGVPLATGGRDHLTHRLLGRVGSSRGLALLLAAGQGTLVGLAIAASQLGPVFAVSAALAAVAGGFAAIVVLDTGAFRPSSAFERGRDRELAARRLGAAEGARGPRIKPHASAEAGFSYSTAVEDPARKRGSR